MRTIRVNKHVARATQLASSKEQITNHDMFELVYAAYDNQDYGRGLWEREAVHTVNYASWGKPSTIVWELNGSPSKSTIIATHLPGDLDRGCRPTFLIRMYGQQYPKVVTSDQVHDLLCILLKGWMKTNLPEVK